MAKIRAAIGATLRDPVYLAAVEKQGLSAKGWDADSYGRLIRAQIDKWTPIIKAAGIKLD
jgi:tripartite-type tricarboxylate transporter receptor subunit TctC